MSETQRTKLPSAGLVSTSPSKWFAQKFPALVAQWGLPVYEVKDRHGATVVKNISQQFLAATAGEAGSPESPTVFLPSENRFYTYMADEGIFVVEGEPALMTRLGLLLAQCAEATRACADVSAMEFKLREAHVLAGVTKHARGILQVTDGFFSSEVSEFIPCANGMLRVADRQLLPFKPSYRRRNKLAVAFAPLVKCPLFLDKLLRPQLAEEDLDLLQRWYGLALTGVNVAQAILIIKGKGGSGKGTAINVLVKALGNTHTAELRAGRLEDRFETSRFLGKTLLHGPDVASDFLNNHSASVLKSLTGGDLLTPELKNSNERPATYGCFNVVINCNGQPKVRIDQDVAAWGRRLRVIDFPNEVADKIPNLDEQILASESAGVLNWALDGLEKLKADNWQLKLTPRQQKLVDDILLESQSVEVFLDARVTKDNAGTLASMEALGEYSKFCMERRWTPVGEREFTLNVGTLVARKFGVVQRNDIPTSSGTDVRGWKGIKLK